MCHPHTAPYNTVPHLARKTGLPPASQQQPKAKRGQLTRERFPSTVLRTPRTPPLSRVKVEKEAGELDWTQQSGGKTVAGRAPAPRAQPAGLPDGGGGYVLVKEAFEGGSGRLGGGSSALTHVRVSSLVPGVLATAKERVDWGSQLLSI